MARQRSIGHQNLFFYLWGTASCLALPTHWFLGHPLSQSLWLPVWACATGIWRKACVKGRGGRLVSAIQFFTLPLALPDLVRESPATSVFRLHQSPLQSAVPRLPLICLTSLQIGINFPRVSHRCNHSQCVLLCLALFVQVIEMYWDRQV